MNAPDQVAERLRTAGMKITSPRMAICRYLHGNLSHPTAEEILAALRPEHPGLSLSTVYATLQALASRPGVVKSRNALMDAAYDDQVYVDDRTIDSHIKRLRKKFKGTDDSFDMIETLYGVGYRFKEM